MSETMTRGDLERLCWHLSGWRLDQRSVDRLLAAIDAYASGAGLSAEVPSLPEPEPQEAAQAPEGVRGASADHVVIDEIPEAVSGPQEGAQGVVPRLHLTGTLTLVCACQSQPDTRKAPATARARPKTLATPDDPAARVCRTCMDRQPLSEFFRDPHGPQGHKSVCRTCDNLRKRTARQQRAQAA
jgi:hypothetical protein